MRTLVIPAVFSVALFAQSPPAKKPFRAQSASTIAYDIRDGSGTVEITNVSYEIAGAGIAGRPPDERMVLRKTTRTKEVVDEKGMEASTTVEAWPLGVDVQQKPLYQVAASGIDPRTENGEVLLISRGLEDTAWWSVYRLGNGAKLFDTYVPLARVSLSKETQTLRYAGLEVPPDDAADARLKAANVVGVLIYASGERVIREALLTCDDPRRAQLLRSYADSTRTLSLTPPSVSVSISRDYPSPPATVTIAVPIARDDLDLAHARLPAGIRIAAWKR